jgi:hypothetical protein
VDVEPKLAPRLAPPKLALDDLDGGVITEPVLVLPMLPLLALVFKTGTLLLAVAGFIPVSRNILDRFSLKRVNRSRALTDAEGASRSILT